MNNTKDMSAGQLRSALYRLEGQRREAWRKYYALLKKYNELQQEVKTLRGEESSTETDEDELPLTELVNRVKQQR